MSNQSGARSLGNWNRAWLPCALSAIRSADVPASESRSKISSRKNALGNAKNGFVGRARSSPGRVSLSSLTSSRRPFRSAVTRPLSLSQCQLRETVASEPIESLPSARAQAPAGRTLSHGSLSARQCSSRYSCRANSRRSVTKKLSGPGARVPPRCCTKPALTYRSAASRDVLEQVGARLLGRGRLRLIDGLFCLTHRSSQALDMSVVELGIPSWIDVLAVVVWTRSRRPGKAQRMRERSPAMPHLDCVAGGRGRAQTAVIDTPGATTHRMFRPRSVVIGG